jgi:GTP-binding protein SAR1
MLLVYRQPASDDISIDGIRLTVLDTGGMINRDVPLERFLPGVNGIIFIVDAADYDRFQESQEELKALLAMEQLKNVPFLILGNKIDDPNAVSEEELRDQLQISNISAVNGEIPLEGTRPIELFMCSIVRRQGEILPLSTPTLAV